ncbi:hypothetical protein [Pseudomonas putida]|uniref:Uncharacterized protein n=1 Tax=Pseudomonas putida TaxID=303 RepID=A0A1Q9R0D4_PSEPU|nr:hypothetical protein [Pseudomonas putida]OLS60846.1 hypothetical protein PSEMO_42490 [Pseudomonas putida]
MKYRGKHYWAWAEAPLMSRSHEEVLDGGEIVDVQVRLSRLGATQLFIGVYNAGGTLMFEETYDSRPGETMTRAMNWGTARARLLASESMGGNIVAVL